MNNTLPRRQTRTRATYEYEVLGDVIAIVDLDQGRSVTNDVDRVLDDLRQHGHDLTYYKVIYRDTRGVWDEIALTETGSWNYRSINEMNIAAALAKVRAR